MNGEEKVGTTQNKKTAPDRSGAWVGGNKISGFLKIFKNRGNKALWTD